MQSIRVWIHFRSRRMTSYRASTRRAADAPWLARARAHPPSGLSSGKKPCLPQPRLIRWTCEPPCSIDALDTSARTGGLVDSETRDGQTTRRRPGSFRPRSRKSPSPRSRALLKSLPVWFPFEPPADHPGQPKFRANWSQREYRCSLADDSGAAWALGAVRARPAGRMRFRPARAFEGARSCIRRTPGQSGQVLRGAVQGGCLGW